MADITPKEIDRETLQALLRRGARLVDVLPRAEYDQIHLAGATSLPLAMISRHTADRLQWDKPLIVYARDATDDRSARAVWRLASLGFTQVFRYTAGRAEWVANGLPIEGTDAQTPAGDLADLDVPTCTRLERVGDVRDRVRREGWDLCVVINDDQVVLGLLTGNDFDKADPKWSAEETMERDPLAYRLDASREEVAAQLDRSGAPGALVTTTDGKLFGWLRREDFQSKD